MSTPNPTHIDVIAHALADAADDGCFDNPPCCDEPPCSDACGTDLDEWHSGEEDREHWTKLARASVSKLTDAGYSIVQSAGAIELAQIVKELAYLTNQNQEFRDFYFGTYANSDRWQALQERALAAAAAEGEKP